MFSKELITYTITYFKDRYNHNISEEIAQHYLQKCAALVVAYKALIEEKSHAASAASMIE